MLGSLLLAPLLQAAALPTIAVSVDSAAREVAVAFTTGDESAPDSGPDATMYSHEGHALHIERMVRFRWPVTGWLRGARVDVFDAAGRLLPQQRVHHTNIINFDRAQLVHPGAERLWAAGQETDAVMLPASVGVPVQEGMRMGMVAAYAPTDLPPGSVVRLTFRWSPANTFPRPVDILPVAVGINYRVDGSSAYDLPPGRSEQRHEFTMPMDGRVLGVGGHLHDHALEVRLEEAESGRVIARLETRRDSAGRLLGIPRRLFGVSGSGKALEGGRRYRVVAVYDNPTGRTLRGGGMAAIAMGFTPARMADVPALDSSAAAVAADLAHIQSFERTTAAVHRH